MFGGDEMITFDFVLFFADKHVLLQALANPPVGENETVLSYGIDHRSR